MLYSSCTNISHPLTCWVCPYSVVISIILPTPLLFNQIHHPSNLLYPPPPLILPLVKSTHPVNCFHLVQIYHIRWPAAYVHTEWGFQSSSPPHSSLTKHHPSNLLYPPPLILPLVISTHLVNCFHLVQIYHIRWPAAYVHREWWFPRLCETTPWRCHQNRRILRSHTGRKYIDNSYTLIT